MSDDPEKPLTLGLAHDRFLDAMINSPEVSPTTASSDAMNNSPDDEPIDPEEAAEELAFEQQEAAEKLKQAEANRALGLTDDEREDLFARFRDLQVLINACNVAVGIAFFFAVRYGFEAINHSLAGPPTNGRIHLFPDPIIWWFFAGFGALTLPWEITLQIWALFGNRRTVYLYRQWRKRSTFDFTDFTYNDKLALYHWFILLITIPIAIANSLALNMHCTVGPDAIQVCGYAFRPCTVLPYSDIKAIAYLAPKYPANPPAAAKLIIEFKNGPDRSPPLPPVEPTPQQFGRCHGPPIRRTCFHTARQAPPATAR